MLLRLHHQKHLLQVATLEGSPQIQLRQQPSSAEKLLLSNMECSYRLSAAVRTKVVASLNILLEKKFSDDGVMIVRPFRSSLNMRS
jgi:hypothetical protein